MPVHWLLGAEFKLIDRLPQLSLPKLVIHGDRDDIIPIEFGRQVFARGEPEGLRVVRKPVYELTYYDSQLAAYTRIPFYWIFDEKRRRDGPLSGRGGAGNPPGGVPDRKSVV